MVAKAHFRKEPRSAIDGGGVRPHTQRVIPGPEPATIPALASTGTALVALHAGPAVTL